MRKNPKGRHVAVISTSFDDISNTKKLIVSFRKQNYGNSELIIVDHGKHHKTYKEFSGKFAKIEIIKASPELWWTGAINAGISYVLKKVLDGDYILTINNDCTFDRDYISKIVNFSRKHKRAIIGSFEIESGDKKTVLTGLVKADWKNGTFENLLNARHVNADTLSTKGTLIPVEVFKKIGLLDEKHFPHYGSDYEFFIRAQRNHFKLLSPPSIKIYCDQNRTGLSDLGGRLNIIRLFNLAFSRKSQINLFDHINLVRFCCPKKYRARNYIFILKKTAYLSSKIYPFSFVRKLIYKYEES